MTLKLIVIHHPKKGYDNNVEPITIRGKNLHDEYLQLLNILKERTTARIVTESVKERTTARIVTESVEG